ncbi:hypothetical protein F5880DRAFT_1512808, partial [Lentinula raphanica]
MELLEYINDSLRLAQETWDAEVEKRAQLMSVARVTTKEDENSFLKLASETRTLLSWVDSSTVYHKHAITALDTTHHIPLVKWIPRNAERLHRLILQSPRICEEMLTDPLLKNAFMFRIEAAYSQGSGARFDSNLEEDSIQSFLLPRRQEIRRVLTAAFKLDCFLKRIPITQHFPTPTIAYDTSTRSVSAPLAPNLPQDMKSSTDPPDVEEHILNLSVDASLEYLKSSFIRQTDNKLRKVLKVIGHFSDDGAMFASDIDQTHERLQACLQHHRKNLESLNDTVEKMNEQVNHILDLLQEKPPGEVDRVDTLETFEFGQAHATGYIEELWTIALRLLPLK